MENFCVKCNKQFKNKTTYNTHIKTSIKCGSTSYNKIFECEFCKKKLSTKQMLSYHIKSFHNNENNSEQIVLTLKQEFEKEKELLQCQTTNSITKLHNEYYNYFRILQNDNKVTILELNKQNIQTLKDEQSKLISILKEEHKEQLNKLKDEYQNSINIQEKKLFSFQQYIYEHTSSITDIHEELKKIKNIIK